MTIQKLPIDIQKRVLDNVNDSYCTYLNPSRIYELSNIQTMRLERVFNWDKSIERRQSKTWEDLWFNVYTEDYSLFYELYPKYENMSIKELTNYLFEKINKL